MVFISCLFSHPGVEEQHYHSLWGRLSPNVANMFRLTPLIALFSSTQITKVCCFQMLPQFPLVSDRQAGVSGRDWNECTGSLRSHGNTDDPLIHWTPTSPTCFWSRPPGPSFDAGRTPALLFRDPNCPAAYASWQCRLQTWHQYWSEKWSVPAKVSISSQAFCSVVPGSVPADRKRKCSIKTICDFCVDVFVLSR